MNSRLVTDWLLKKHSFNKDERHSDLQIFYFQVVVFVRQPEKKRKETFNNVS